MKGNQIDDLFRQKLSHQKLAPPPAAWSAIEQNLPQKKKKGAYFWLSVAASILVIFTIGGLLLIQGQKSDITQPDTLAKTNTPEVKTPVKADEPVETLVAKEAESTPEIIKENLNEPVVKQLVAKTSAPPAQIMASPSRKGRNTQEFNELLMREPAIEVALISIDQRMAPRTMAMPLNYGLVMPLDVTAYYKVSNEELELTQKKKKFRVLNGIISIAKEVNSGKLSLSELRNAKNNFVVDDLKYGSRETDSDTDEDEPETPGKD